MGSHCHVALPRALPRAWPNLEAYFMTSMLTRRDIFAAGTQSHSWS